MNAICKTLQKQKDLEHYLNNADEATFDHLEKCERCRILCEGVVDRLIEQEKSEVYRKAVEAGKESYLYQAYSYLYPDPAEKTEKLLRFLEMLKADGLAVPQTSEDMAFVIGKGGLAAKEAQRVLETVGGKMLSAAWEKISTGSSRQPVAPGVEKPELEGADLADEIAQEPPWEPEVVYARAAQAPKDPGRSQAVDDKSRTTPEEQGIPSSIACEHCGKTVFFSLKDQTAMRSYWSENPDRVLPNHCPHCKGLMVLDFRSRVDRIVSLARKCLSSPEHGARIREFLSEFLESEKDDESGWAADLAEFLLGVKECDAEENAEIRARIKEILS